MSAVLLSFESSTIYLKCTNKMDEDSEVGDIHKPEWFVESGEDVAGSIISESCISCTT